MVVSFFTILFSIYIIFEIQTDIVISWPPPGVHLSSLSSLPTSSSSSEGEETEENEQLDETNDGMLYYLHFFLLLFVY